MAARTPKTIAIRKPTSTIRNGGAHNRRRRSSRRPRVETRLPLGEAEQSQRRRRPHPGTPLSPDGTGSPRQSKAPTLKAEFRQVELASPNIEDSPVRKLNSIRRKQAAQRRGNSEPGTTLPPEETRQPRTLKTRTGNRTFCQTKPRAPNTQDPGIGTRLPPGENRAAANTPHSLVRKPTSTTRNRTPPNTGHQPTPNATEPETPPPSGENRAAANAEHSVVRKPHFRQAKPGTAELQRPRTPNATETRHRTSGRRNRGASDLRRLPGSHSVVSRGRGPASDLLSPRVSASAGSVVVAVRPLGRPVSPSRRWGPRRVRTRVGCRRRCRCRRCPRRR